MLGSKRVKHGGIWDLQANKPFHSCKAWRYVRDWRVLRSSWMALKAAVRSLGSGNKGPKVSHFIPLHKTVFPVKRLKRNAAILST